MKFRKLILITSWIIFSGWLHAQQIGEPYSKVNIYPPEAASLMRAVDYPVGHLTGMPDIRIPLHFIKIGSFSFPIELSFHLDNFIKANQMPGCSGAGWSLNTELQITRTINGGDDLRANDGGYCYSPTVVADYTGSSVSRTKKQLNAMVNGYNDEQPDRFYYQIIGKSGAFYFQKQNDGSFKPIAVPDNGVRIDYVDAKFTILDTDGTTYLFSTSKVDMESQNPASPHILAWKCETIKDESSQVEASFEYDYKYDYTIINYSDRIEIYDDVNNPNDAGCYNNTPPSNCQSCENDGWDNPTTLELPQIAGPKLIEYGTTETRLYTYNQDGLFQYVGEYNNIPGAPTNTYINMSCFLTSRINFRGGSIEYSYINANELSTIVVKNNIGDTIKSIKFSQSYKGTQSSTFNRNKYKHSRKLDELKINNEKYSFSYGFERQYGNVSDFWGYKAFEPTLESLVPKQDIEISMGNGSKLYDCSTVDWSEGILQNNIGSGNSEKEIFDLNNEQKTALIIRYPTGGKVEFIVGQHKFRDIYDSSVKGTGGYRVEEIRYFDNMSELPVRKRILKYGSNEDGAGLIKSMPSFDPYSGNTFIETTVHYLTRCLGDLNTTRKRTYLSGSTRSLTFSNGAPVNYNEVAEYEMDMGQITGKTVYKYDLYHYTPPYSSPTDPFPLEKVEWDLAMPDSIIYYKYVDNHFEWVKRKNIDYNKYLEPYKIFRGRASIYEPYLLTGTGGTGCGLTNWSQDLINEEYAGFDYKTDGIETGIMQLVLEEVEEKDGNGNIIRTAIKYSYDNAEEPSNVTQIERTESNGTLLRTFYTYPSDISFDDTEENDCNEYCTTLREQFLTCRDECYWSNDTLEGAENCIYSDCEIPIEAQCQGCVTGEIFNFNVCLANCENDKPLEQSTDGRAIKAMVEKNMISIPIQVLEKKDGNVIGGKITKYKRLSTNIIVPGVSYSIETTKPLTSIEDPYIDSEDTLVIDESFKDKIHFDSYDEYGNITQVHKTGDIPTSYLWGYNNTLPVAKIVGLSYEEVKKKVSPGDIQEKTGEELSTILAPLRKLDAMVTIYTYDPLIGMTSMTDENGLTTYYEYDDFGRLKCTRDDDGNIINTYKYHYAGEEE